MSTKRRHKRRKYHGQNRPPQPRLHRFPWLWLAGGGVLLLILGSILVWTSSRSAARPLANGAPRLVVDQTVVDEGYVQFDVPVRTTFRLTNVGDQLLKILSEPQVELIEGC